MLRQPHRRAACAASAPSRAGARPSQLSASRSSSKKFSSASARPPFCSGPGPARPSPGLGKRSTRRAVANVQTETALSPQDLAALPLPPPGAGAAAGAGAGAGAATDRQPQAQAAPAPGAGGDLFDFERCWYPLALLETLKTDRPNALALIGKDLVVWRPLTAGPQEGPPTGEAGGVRRRFADGSWDDPSADGWVVQQDVCPHRLAPLSEGRLEADGTVQCSYHGWRFDAGGKLALIPQLEKVDPPAHARACAHPKSCVSVFPCRAFAGLLWVWGESGGADVALRAATTPPTCIPRGLMPQPQAEAATAAAPAPGAAAAAAKKERLRPAGAGWYARDVPVGSDVLLENFVDPSHVNFSHHRVIGDRDAEQGITMRLVSAAVARGARDGGAYCSDAPLPLVPAAAAAAAEASPISRDGGYTFEVRPPNGLDPYLLHFRPPGHAWFEFPPPPDAASLSASSAASASSSSPSSPSPSSSSSAGAQDDGPQPEGRVSMLLYCTPTRPGWSRVFVSMVSPEGCPLTAPPMPDAPLPLQWLIKLMDRVPALQHALNRGAILDGDDLFLAAQHRVLYAKGGATHASWRESYYLPTSADVGVAALRRWIDLHGRKMPFLPGGLAPGGAPPDAQASSSGGGAPAAAASSGPGAAAAAFAAGAAAAAASKPQPLGRSEVFDRFNQHSKDCPHCTAAITGCEAALWVLGAVAVACAGASLFAAMAAAAGLVAPAGRALALSAGSAAVGVACALAARAVWSFRQLFVYYDYQHAEH